jgi:hypothetical protein
MSGNAFFVGSIPGTTVEQVMTRCARAAGDEVFAFTDGELGPRQRWAVGLLELLWSKHPDFELVSRGYENDPEASKDPGERRVFDTYKVREGVDPRTVSLDDLFPYAAFGIESYATFKRLRDDGVLPAGARFQVSLPTPHAAVVGAILGPADVRVLMKAWAHALRTGYDRLLDEIPAEDLVIQLDYATELADIYAGGMFSEWIGYADGNNTEKLEIYTSREYLASMTENLPETVTFGYHLCLGTYPEWPGNPQPDLGFVVELANRMVENTPRRVDFLHLPGMRDADSDFYAPLRELTPGPKVFMGIECRDGANGLKRRIGIVKEHLDDFGVAHYCGYGREQADTIDKLLADLAEGAGALTTAEPAAGRAPN